MKKSEKYLKAMMVVVDSMKLEASEKLEIIEQLLNDKSVAEFTERHEKADDRGVWGV